MEICQIPAPPEKGLSEDDKSSEREGPASRLEPGSFGGDSRDLTATP